MLTTEQIVESLRAAISPGRLGGDVVALRDAQRVAGFLMQAAEQAGGQDAARGFHLLAAEAANSQDAVADDDR